MHVLKFAWKYWDILGGILNNLCWCIENFVHFTNVWYGEEDGVEDVLYAQTYDGVEYFWFFVAVRLV